MHRLQNFWFQRFGTCMGLFSNLASNRVFCTLIYIQYLTTYQISYNVTYNLKNLYLKKKVAFMLVLEFMSNEGLVSNFETDSVRLFF